MSPRKKTKKKYKIKTRKATAKRFRKTGGGKITRMKSDRSHLRRRKSKRAKRMFKKMHEVTARGIKRRVKRLAPNLGRPMRAAGRSVFTPAEFVPFIESLEKDTGMQVVQVIHAEGK